MALVYVSFFGLLLFYWFYSLFGSFVLYHFSLFWFGRREELVGSFGNNAIRLELDDVRFAVVFFLLLFFRDYRFMGFIILFTFFGDFYY